MKCFATPKKLYRAVLALVVCAFILTNICAQLFVEKFSIKLDMTEEKLYAFSPVTQEIAASLDEAVHIYVLCSRGDYPAMFVEVLDRYSRLTGSIVVAYIDPYANPMFVDHYKQLGYTLAEFDIVVEGTDGVKQIAYESMLVYADDQLHAVQIEQQISSALLYVNNPEKLTAAFTTGHNERGTTALENLFYDNNFRLETLYLTAGEPTGADIMVIASPTRDFTGAEITALEQYMSRGGKLMIFLEPGVNSYPLLGGFLADWNLAVSDNVILEQRAYVSDNPLNLVPQYAAHEINAYFTDNQYYVVMPSSRGITILNSSLGAVESKRVLASTSDSYAKNGMQYASTDKEPGDKGGPFALAATSEKVVATEQGTGTASVFLAGSRYIYADDIMGTPSFANKDFLTQVVNYLSNSAASISIPAKTTAAPALNIRLDQSIPIGVVLVAVIPLGIVAAGIAVCAKRKNR